jgi:hypothetical protein
MALETSFCNPVEPPPEPRIPSDPGDFRDLARFGRIFAPIAAIDPRIG